MFCTQCGTENNNEARFCRNCAAPLKRTAQPGMQAEGYGASVEGGYQPGQSIMPGPQSMPPYQSGYPGYTPASQQGASGRAITAMVLSLLSIVTCLGFLLSVPGMILGKMEMNAIRDGRAPRAGEGFAKTGFYVGLVVTALSVLGFVFFFFTAIPGSIFN